MSHRATNWAVEQRGIRPIAKVILWHLADRHHPENGCFPDQETLATDCEISRSSVNRHLTELEEAGLIRREQRVDEDTGRQLPTRYRLAFEEGFEPLHVVPRVSSGDTARVSESDGSVCQNEGAPCVTADTRIEGLTSKLTGKSEPGRTREALRKEFDHNIWAEFPRNPRSDKAAAFDAYVRLDPGDRVACIGGVARVALRFEEAKSDEPLERRLKYHPHLVTWIKARGWEQELQTA